jgi:hypothetical protein
MTQTQQEEAAIAYAYQNGFGARELPVERRQQMAVPRGASANFISHTTNSGPPPLYEAGERNFADFNEKSDTVYENRDFQKSDRDIAEAFAREEAKNVVVKR